MEEEWELSDSSGEIKDAEMLIPDRDESFF